MTIFYTCESYILKLIYVIKFARYRIIDNALKNKFEILGEASFPLPSVTPMLGRYIDSSFYYIRHIIFRSDILSILK